MPDVSAPPPPAQYAPPVQPEQTYTEPAPAQPAGATDGLAQLKQLDELLSTGVLTTAEFEREKARVATGCRASKTASLIDVSDGVAASRDGTEAGHVWGI